MSGEPHSYDIDAETRDQPGKEIYYSIQTKNSDKGQLWDTCVQYPANLHECTRVVEIAREEQAYDSSKPLRVIKVTINTEIIEAFNRGEV